MKKSIETLSIISVLLGCLLNFNIAQGQEPGEASREFGEIGIELGVFILLGSDFQLWYSPDNSSWIYGYRQLKTEDDFVNEAAFGFTGNDSDREITIKSGPFVR